MSLIVPTGSASAADEAAHRLRREGFLARSACRGGTYLVIVECLSDDRDAVLSRVERCDAADRSLRTA
jgi:hypothetical protein